MAVYGGSGDKPVMFLGSAVGTADWVDDEKTAIYNDTTGRRLSIAVFSLFLIQNINLKPCSFLARLCKVLDQVTHFCQTQ